MGTKTLLIVGTFWRIGSFLLRQNVLMRVG